MTGCISIFLYICAVYGQFVLVQDGAAVSCIDEVTSHITIPYYKYSTFFSFCVQVTLANTKTTPEAITTTAATGPCVVVRGPAEGTLLSNTVLH